MYEQVERRKENKSRTITQRNKCPKQSFGIVNRRHGSSALGGVRNRMNQKVGAGLGISTVVQRQIGQNGDVGQEVMYNGKKNWKIVNKELVDGKNATLLVKNSLATSHLQKTALPENWCK
ncbi:hypothetical protein MED121_01220 [Marinomonas sp. MED121]|uniref:hypothetical protein n=1 Tax=Marinomonas sp. MED121 TaxID=314277 RepID=UPI0000690A5F|nr:hypothetical protein [Marinomonas sp. MED121]EAQ63198.1 hypothetical protein MED121_01220 [Marinomonas sp. MED121]